MDCPHYNFKDKCPVCAEVAAGKRCDNPDCNHLNANCKWMPSYIRIAMKSLIKSSPNLIGMSDFVVDDPDDDSRNNR